MGKSSSPTTSTVNQSNLPDYAEPYFVDLLKQTQGETSRAYEPYTGQRLADESQYTQQGRDVASGIDTQPYIDAATGGTNQALGAAQGYQNYNPYDFGNVADFRTDVSSFMSPYMQDVVQQEQNNAYLNFDRQQAGRDAQAVQAGAFGGSRGAVQDALATEALNRDLQGIQAKGAQNAFENAQQAFGQQRQATMQNQSSQADENRLAAQLGLSASELSGRLSDQLAQLGLSGQDAEIARAQLLDKIGQDIEARNQAGLDIGYQDFVRQRDYPREQLQFYNSILRGVPVTPSTESTQFQYRDPVSQALGTGISALGLYKAMG